MKTVVILCVLLSAALSTSAAPVEDAVQPQDNPALKSGPVEDAVQPQEDPALKSVEDAVQPQEDPALKSGPVEDAVQPQEDPALYSARFGLCLEDWKYDSGNCYYLSNIYQTWNNAEIDCARRGGNLASAHTIWEYSLLKRLVKTGGHSQAWMGGYSFEGWWRWEDGSLFSYTNWGGSSSASTSNRCLQLNTFAGWTSRHCSNRLPYVCKKKLFC